MTTSAHLWAIGYDDQSRAEEVRNEILKLGTEHSLDLLDTAVAVRFFDGSLTLDGERFVIAELPRRSVARFFAGLILGAPPLSGAAAGALCRATSASSSDEIRIDEHVVVEVQRRMKLGTSVLFVLDREGDMDAILQGVRGLGGTVLKTTVDAERARLIQSALTPDPNVPERTGP
jgi:uncharacterized membrane protein